MATYDYKCAMCDLVAPITHSVNETPLVECQLCGKKMRKLFTAPTVKFKGSGWGKDAR
jgi:putative FmdB family regulatory protein